MLKPTFENRNYAFAGAFVDELARCGLRHVCICPGSRSSPLAISFVRNQAIKTWVHLDERSASFFALGIARALGEPVALVCSSGTATANFFPAMIEAHQNSVPLLALTADRPPELMEWGALQTADQAGMYGSHTKWSANMPAPEATADLMASVRSTACRAFYTAAAAPEGPVHINFPFREPLEPVSCPTDFPESTVGEAWRGRTDGKPFVSTSPAGPRLGLDGVRRIAEMLTPTRRGLIVCGPQDDSRLAKAVTALAKQLDYPILADAFSQVRCGPHDRSMVIDCYDAFLRDTDVVESLAPDVIIRIGALPVSKPLTEYMAHHNTVRQIQVDEGAAWRDPFHVTSELLRVAPGVFCKELLSALDATRSPGEWSNRWRNMDDAARVAMQREADAFGGMFEGKVYSELAQLLPERAVLFAGNSMPVRDMDTFFPSSAQGVRFLSNRGASGIDGVVSTALGVGAVTSERLVLVLGDISFYHDMNGLLAAKAHQLNATIIVINNDGGGIFSFLPQAAYPDVFESVFGTPHSLTFRATADLYGLDYCIVHDWSEFDEAVKESLNRAGTTIIEVSGDRTLNVELHRRVWNAVGTSAKALMGR